LCYSTALKNVIGLNKQCQNTSLFLALKVELLETKLIINKLNFYIRLTKNCLTAKIIKEISCDSDSRYLQELNDLTKSQNIPSERQYCERIMTQRAVNKIMDFKTREDAMRRADTNVNRLYSAFKIGNRDLFLKKVWSIIGF
jgi:hypothetical protein